MDVELFGIAQKDVLVFSPWQGTSFLKRGKNMNEPKQAADGRALTWIVAFLLVLNVVQALLELGAIALHAQSPLGLAIVINLTNMAKYILVGLFISSSGASFGPTGKAPSKSRMGSFPFQWMCSCYGLLSRLWRH
jgi:hypothetical protein